MLLVVFFMTSSLSLYDPLSLSSVGGKKPQSHIRSSLSQPSWLFSFGREHARDRKTPRSISKVAPTQWDRPRESANEAGFQHLVAPKRFALEIGNTNCPRVEWRNVCCRGKKPQITSPPAVRPTKSSHRHRCASESKMAITSFFLRSTSCC